MSIISTCIFNTFAGSLLDVCWTFAGSCKHRIKHRSCKRNLWKQQRLRSRRCRSFITTITIITTNTTTTTTTTTHLWSTWHCSRCGASRWRGKWRHDCSMPRLTRTTFHWTADGTPDWKHVCTVRHNSQRLSDQTDGTQPFKHSLQRANDASETITYLRRHRSRITIICVRPILWPPRPES